MYQRGDAYMGLEAPKLPGSLPKILSLAVSNAPEHMKAAIINSLFPAMGSLMHNVGFRYPDNVYHEPHFMCGIVGPMSLGKGCIFFAKYRTYITPNEGKRLENLHN